MVIDQSKVAVSSTTATESDSEFRMLMFKGRCKECEEEVALYDFDNKQVFFSEVVPSYIG